MIQANKSQSTVILTSSQPNPPDSLLQEDSELSA